MCVCVCVCVWSREGVLRPHTPPGKPLWENSPTSEECFQVNKYERELEQVPLHSQRVPLSLRRMPGAAGPPEARGTYRLRASWAEEA